MRKLLKVKEKVKRVKVKKFLPALSFPR